MFDIECTSNKLSFKIIHRMIENEDYHLAISEKSRLTQHYS